MANASQQGPRGPYATAFRDDRLIKALDEHGGTPADLYRRLQGPEARSSWPNERALRRTLARLEQSGHVVALARVGAREKRFKLTGAGRSWADALR